LCSSFKFGLVGRGTLEHLKFFGLALSFLFCSSSFAADAVSEAQAKKDEIVKAEAESRDVLNELYLIQKKVKEISKSRSHLNQMMLSSDGDAQSLAHSVSAWQKKLDAQREQLSRRLGLLYRWNSPNLLPFIFSSSSATDFEKNMRFLKLFAEKDFAYLHDFQKTLLAASAEKSKLNSKIRSLLSLRKLVAGEEKKMADAFARKTALLAKLKTERDQGIKGLQNLRETHPEIENLLQTGFFEKRGLLNSPVRGQLETKYGTTVDKTYRFRLLNKGWSFQTGGGDSVHAVFNGEVVFAAKLPGYGFTTVVDHGDHYYTVYAWMDQALVKVGATVTEDQVIGRAGPRTYFEIRHFSEAMDPVDWIKDPKREIASVE
jgi:murein hydrolase activator